MCKISPPDFRASGPIRGIGNCSIAGGVQFCRRGCSVGTPAWCAGVVGCVAVFTTLKLTLPSVT